MPKLDFHQLDVFTSQPGAGNPLAVVLDGSALDSAAMQRFARWINLSETTFVLPPTQPQASYRLRIFTPKQELPFAGHPSIGTAHALLSAGRIQASNGGLIQECAAGLLPIRVDGDGLAHRIYVRAPKIKQIAIDAQTLVDAALTGLTRGSLLPALLDNGPRWWCVQLTDENMVRQMTPNLAQIAELTIATQAVGLCVYAHSAAPDYQLVLRAFCPADGIPEDPVTGSANAAVGAWLARNGKLPSMPYLASQGREVGRNGFVNVEYDDDGQIWIGGQTQTIIEGALQWQ